MLNHRPASERLLLHASSQLPKKYRFYANLFEYVESGGKGFVLSNLGESFEKTCCHDWVVLDSCFACCRICGATHECHRGRCPETKTDNSSHVCTITGVVTMKSEFREERNMHERVCFYDGGHHDEEDRDDGCGHGGSMSMAFAEDRELLQVDAVSTSTAATAAIGGKRKRRAAAAGEDDGRDDKHHNKNKKKKRITVVEMNMWLTTSASIVCREEDSNTTTSTMRHHMLCMSSMTCANNPYSVMILSLFNESINKVHESVESVVCDILGSEKTHFCFMQEIDRNEAKLCALFSKLLRETAHNKTCLRPNVLDLFSQVYYQARKCRLSYHGFADQRIIHGHQKKTTTASAVWKTDKTFQLGPCGAVRRLVKTCTESIVNLLMSYGGLRVVRHLQNIGRRREFICSMLYLMRMGITYQNRQLLPKIDVLHEYLPMQVLLPVVFKIRAKSITEGENIIKLDIRKMPV